jgi:molybdopterin converting factor small subunit
MKVNLKCFSTLVKPESCDFKAITVYNLDDGATLSDLIDRAGINKQDVKVAFVNNRIVGFDAILTNGDNVGLSPAVGGM